MEAKNRSLVAKRDIRTMRKIHRIIRSEVLKTEGKNEGNLIYELLRILDSSGQLKKRGG